MKTIIAGGRQYQFTPADAEWLSMLKDSLPITEIVCGMAAGADKEGLRWAHDHDIPVKAFPADWVGNGRSAGPIRNQEMAEYAQALVVFPGGKGTADMVSRAMAFGLPIYRGPSWRYV